MRCRPPGAQYHPWPSDRPGERAFRLVTAFDTDPSRHRPLPLHRQGQPDPMTHQRTLTAAHWGVYEVEYDDDGKATRLHPFSKDPDPSPIGLHMLSDEVARLRVRRPAVRKSWLEHGPGASPSGAARSRSSRCRGTRRSISSPANWRA